MPAINSIEQIYPLIEEALADMGPTLTGKPIAAFDADGTLWDTDIGENFFKYQADNKLVELPENAWEYYCNWHEMDAIPAYIWLAQINKGVPLEKVREWAKQAVEKLQPLPVFPHMIELINFLKEKDFEIYIVTASVKWAVEPAAELIGIDRDHVVGIETEVVDKIVTDRAVLPVTWREGKKIALLKKTGNRAPVLAAGNTTGDQFLLDCASDIPFAHTTVSPKHSIYKTEKALLDMAKINNWFWWEA